MMHQTQRLTKHKTHLEFLVTAKPIHRHLLIRTSTNGLLQTICECAFNVLRGIPKLTTEERHKLHKYKHFCRYLANKSHSLVRKRQLLLKNKTLIIPPLLGPVIRAMSWLEK